MESSTAEKKPRGRPSKYPSIDLDRVKKLCDAGLTINQLAVALDVNPETIYRWAKEYDEFSKIIKGSKALADDHVERALYERATGYTHPEDKIFIHDGCPVVVPTERHYPPDTAAAFIWLKNRRPDKWRDKQVIDINNNAEDERDLTDEEMLAIADALDRVNDGDPDNSES